MKSKLFIPGIIFGFLLLGCIIFFAVAWTTGRLLFKPRVEKPKVVQISQVAPLATPVVYVAQTSASSPPGLMAASLQEVTNVEPSATPTLPATPTLVPTSTPTPLPPPSPTPVVAQPGIATRLVIPRLDLDRPVLFSPVEEGTWQVSHLEQALGHLEGTAGPGASDNIVLAGHVTLDTGESGPFARLDLLAPGDIMKVYEGEKEYFYLVESRQVVDPTDVRVVYPTNSGQLTLITCANWSSQEGRYTNRLVVKGRLLRG